MEENFERGMAAVEWAADHYAEWEIICGLRLAGIKRHMEVYEMLKRDGLQELQEMIVCRIYAMMLEEEKGEGAGKPL